MNTIIALMLVTAQGATQIATFDSVEACNHAKAQIKNSDSFCYERAPINTDQALDDAMNHMSKMLTRMKKEMDTLRAKEKAEESI